MASSSNSGTFSSGSSSSSGYCTPSSSTHASAAGTNNSALGYQPWQSSYQVRRYLDQPATEDGTIYGRIVSLPSQTAADPNGRIPFYTTRVQGELGRFDQRFGGP